MFHIVHPTGHHHSMTCIMEQEGASRRASWPQQLTPTRLLAFPWMLTSKSTAWPVKFVHYDSIGICMIKPL